MAKQIRICIKNDEEIFKIFSLYILSDGSLKIDIPYCPYKEGLLLKVPVNYSKRDLMIPADTISQKFTSFNRPQLSIHKSGFIQFSGTGIISGIDPITQKAKGLGIFINPLDIPILSGPTFGVTIWGIHAFDRINSIRQSDILIDQKDFINRILIDKKRDSPENVNLNTYLIEGFIFPNELSSLIRKTKTGEEATLPFPQYHESPGAIFTFPVVRLTNHKSFIGLIPFKINTMFPDEIDYGFNLIGPSGRSEKTSLHNSGMLMATSTKDLDPTLKNSIEYQKETKCEEVGTSASLPPEA